MYKRKTERFKPKNYNSKLNKTTTNFNHLKYLQKSVDNLNISSDDKTKAPLIKFIKVKTDQSKITASKKINKTFQLRKTTSKNLNTSKISAATEKKPKKLNFKKLNIEINSSKKSKKTLYKALYTLPITNNSKNEKYNGLNKINCSTESNSVSETLKKFDKINLSSELNKTNNKEKKSFKDLIRVKKRILGVDLKMRDIMLIKDKMKEEILTSRNKTRNNKLKYKKTPEKTNRTIVKIIDDEKICILSKLNFSTIKTSRNLDNQYSMTLNENEADSFNKKIEEKLNKNFQVNLSFRGLDLMKKIEHSVEKKYNKTSRITLNKLNKNTKLILPNKK